MSDRVQRLARARLYLVCDERPVSFLEAALRGGVDIVQLRVKEPRPTRGCWRPRGAMPTRAPSHGALFIVNDRPDLAVQAGADGVHVGQDDIAVAQARSIVGPDRLVGRSTHSPGQIDAAQAEAVDYIGVGPVHATPTKPGRPAVGLELVRYAAAHSPLPFFAIGGITTGNVGAVAAAGALRVAVVRALTEARDPEAAARALRGALLDRAPAAVPVPIGERVGST